MEWINKIGQRNVAKYLVVFSLLICLIIFCMKFVGFGASQVKPNLNAVVMGVLFFSLSNIILCWCAHKSREYRLFSIYASGAVLLLNTLIFALSLKNPVFAYYLILLSLAEIILSIIFSLFVFLSEKKKEKQKSLNAKRKKPNQTVEQTMRPE